jgi:16S rRNA (cytidine1402-2'-O)-methyltransferase
MKLYIIPSPIGNLEDITLRALRIMKEVDFLLCEDTRTTQNLLKHYNIQNRCIPYHIHNEHHQLNNIILQIKNAQAVGLLSDAGTPGISDPGFLLVREAIANGINVECLPGATAFVPALINSGFPCDAFYFHGFLPHKKGKETLIRQINESDKTVVFYESPHRLLKTLNMLLKIMGSERKIAISRELSKIHEENFRGSIQEALLHFQSKEVKGEIVICVKGSEK